MPVEWMVEILNTNDDSERSGMGIIVSFWKVVTCSHIVNDALGRDTDCCDEPDQHASIKIKLSGNASPIAMKVHKWTPPDPKQGSNEPYDIAVLKPADKKTQFKKPFATLIHHHTIEEDANNNISISGYSSRYPQDEATVKYTKANANDGKLAELIAIEPKPNEIKRIDSGYSGAPAHLGLEVIGMVRGIRDDDDQTVAYCLPSKSIASVCDDIDIKISFSDNYAHIIRVNDRLEELSKSNSFDVQAVVVENNNSILDIWSKDTKEEYGGNTLKPSSFLRDSRCKFLLLQAPGGAGKTSFLLKLFNSAIKYGTMPFYLDLSHPLQNGVQTNINPATGKYLFDTFAVGGAKYSDLKGLPKKADKLMIVDGLNEAKDDFNNIKGALEDLRAKFNNSCRIVLADRMTEKKDLNGFQIATILPLSKIEIKKHIPVIGKGSKKASGVKSDLRLLSAPFFLDIYVNKKIQDNSRIGMLEHYFTDKKICGIKPEQLKSLSKIAYDAYAKSGSIEIDKTWWESKLNNIGLNNNLQLIKPGVVCLRQKRNKIVFRHQLWHDFLVGYYIAGQIGKWQPKMFDIATIGKRSYEALEFAGEALNGRDFIDYLIEVYDWSWRAVLGILKRLETFKPKRDKNLIYLKEAYYATLAEKRFDHYEHTSGTFSDCAEFFRSKIQINYGGHEQLDGLVSDVETKFQPKGNSYMKKLLSDWEKIFVGKNHTSETLFDHLWDNPFLAWTAANVLRRGKVDDDLFHKLIGAYKALLNSHFCHRNVGARWRIVHILGRSENKVNLEFLQEVVKNDKEDKYVRFGAARSLVESVSLQEENQVRKDALSLLAGSIEDINEPIVVQELRRTAFFSKESLTPKNWPSNYLPVLKAGKIYFMKDKTEENKWSDQIKRINGIMLPN